MVNIDFETISGFPCRGYTPPAKRIIIGTDMYCGAGGTSTGLILAAEDMDSTVDLLAINHWNLAIDTHTRNHPGVRHLCESLDNVDPRRAVPGGRLDILSASPECTHFSNARGGKPRSNQSRAGAFQILRWAEALQIDRILIENVREFKNWGPLNRNGSQNKRRKGQTFAAFLQALDSLGYYVDHRVLNCANYGDATTRQRLFIMARRKKKIVWPEFSHAGAWRSARSIIDFTIKGQFIDERDRPLAGNTIKRIVAGIRKFCGGTFIIQLGQTGGNADYCHSIDAPLPTVMTKQHLCLVEPFVVNLRGTTDGHLKASSSSIDSPLPTVTAGGNHLALCEPFLVKYYGTGGPVSVDQPLDTITGRDRFGLVQGEMQGSMLRARFRLLQPHELSAAMSFPNDYNFAGNRADKVKQIGNAVPVQTARALCRALLS